MAQALVKVVLSSGKVVYLREMKISDNEKAAQKVSRRADGDPLVMQVMMNKAILQGLLAKVSATEAEAPRDITAIEKEDMDALFKLSEFTQLLKVIAKISGVEDAGNEPKMEFVEM